ncbi:hypothetical protein AZE42_11350 [Rhizopogon vesiculosus]|uniref:Uncharacterized protein n=1 Tax=Rhizopogon vesiculosus TaxID=180088 RepID=A0A1J8R1A7_9AGAM|nr:hypothetical protein AZE42_11350 [Rhizopogon vesiculosus]
MNMLKPLYDYELHPSRPVQVVMQPIVVMMEMSSFSQA